MAMIDISGIMDASLAFSSGTKRYFFPIDRAKRAAGSTP
jgi:hypothetical protein